MSRLAFFDSLPGRTISRKRNTMHIIVDGYNLIRQSDTFRHSEMKSLEEGRIALIRSLAGYRKLRGHRITVVFDGWEGGSPREERDVALGVEIIYSRLGEKADEVIKRLLGKGNEESLVVTSDREIAVFAARRGSTAIASAAFDALLARSVAGSSAADVPGKSNPDVDDDRPGMKRKGPSRRLSKQKRAALARFKKL
ncbi:MAG: NYN domain-containing protein [Deltaproteobacteria bacterium]|nr:NYN domain-containing protein [Deltaproteobacteria bacterium]